MTRLLMTALLLATSGAGLGADFELEPAGSSLKFIAVQQAARFESRFEKFSAEVRFDPAEPASGRIRARVDLVSVDTGNPERDEVLKAADWFGVERWPEAVFSADRIVRSGEGFAASGTLSLRGVERPVTLQFDWTPPGSAGPARLVGAAALKRLEFGVGQGDWRDTTYVGDRVEVRVDIRLHEIQASVKSVSTKEGSKSAR